MYNSSTLVKNETVEMSPGYARSLLNNNYVNNRPIRERTVKIWKKLIKEDQFTVGSQIRLAEDGNETVLIDGQHRLMAISESGKTQTVNLITIKVDDIGREYAITDSNNLRRSASDSLGAIIPGTSLSATAVNKMIAGIKLVQNGLSPNRNKESWIFNRVEMAEIARPWIPTMKKYMAFTEHPNPRAMYNVLMRAATVSFGLITVAQQPDKAMEFWDGVSHDEGLYSSDPRRMVRRHLLDGYANTDKEQRTNIGFLGTAWNRFFLDITGKKLRAMSDWKQLAGLDVYKYERFPG